MWNLNTKLDRRGLRAWYVVPTTNRNEAAVKKDYTDKFSQVGVRLKEKPAKVSSSVCKSLILKRHEAQGKYVMQKNAHNQRLRFFITTGVNYNFPTPTFSRHEGRNLLS